MRNVKFGVMVAVTAVAVSIFPGAADARGVVRVQQVDGRIDHYNGVGLRLEGDTLRIISPDRIGTLLVKRAACFVVDGLQRCLPTQLILSQHGTHQITFRRGAVYLNLSDQPHAMPHSSKVVGVRGVDALLETMHGTFITITGQLDEVKP